MGKGLGRADLPAEAVAKMGTGCSAGKDDKYEALRIFCIMTLRSFDEIAAGYQLTSAQWFCLRLLSREGVGSSKKLANRLGYDAGAMTRLLDTLVSLGLVYRQRSESDRRVIKLALTQEAIPIVLDLENKLSGLSFTQPSAISIKIHS